MISSLKQEFFKFSHQKTPLFGILALLILMLYTALTSSFDNSMAISGCGMGQWAVIILIAVGTDFIAMEFRDNTIATLFYKHSKKFLIYLSKFIVVMCYGFILLLCGSIFTFLLTFCLGKNRFPWFNFAPNVKTVLLGLMLTILGTFIYMFFVSGLGFFLICLFRNNAVVIGISLIIAFFGANLSSTIMEGFAFLSPIIKWNPLNMIYIINQLSDLSYEHFSQLSNLGLITGNVIYGLIFFFLGYLLFKNRKV